jgi:hypothetical protein
MHFVGAKISQKVTQLLSSRKMQMFPFIWGTEYGGGFEEEAQLAQAHKKASRRRGPNNPRSPLSRPRFAPTKLPSGSGCVRGVLSGFPFAGVVDVIHFSHLGTGKIQTCKR